MRRTRHCGAAHGSDRGRPLKVLWIVIALQFIVFRRLFLGFNTFASGPDPYNL
jgi:hypothetical protein